MELLQCLTSKIMNPAVLLVECRYWRRSLALKNSFLIQALLNPLLATLSVFVMAVLL